MYSVKGNTIVLGNGLCRIVWNKTAKGWSAQYQCKVKDNWQTVARDDVDTDAAYGIVFGKHSNKRTGLDLYGTVRSTLPPQSILPEIIHQSNESIELKWSFNLVDSEKNRWPIESKYVIQRGQRHVFEEVHFTSPIYTKVRYQRGWQAPDLQWNFYERVAHTVTHTGWKSGRASFLILTNQAPDGWDATSGGGGIVRLSDGFKREQNGYLVPEDDAFYNAYHRVPHVMEKDGWVDTRYFDHYTLRHYLIMYPGPLFKREAIDYVRKLQPLEKLKPRYSWKSFLDKQIEGLKNAPKIFEDHGNWGHNELGWYKGFDPKQTFLQTERQSLDWGGNWDIWQAIALREYGRNYKNNWALRRSRKIINGIKCQLWQIDDTGTHCDGAFWMFRPRTKEEYEKRKASKPSGEKGGTIQKGADLWICDSGKIGYYLCELYEKTDDKELLGKTKQSAKFLLSLQQADGNLRAGRIHISGTMVYPANLATNSCAIMLWSRLYEITKDEKYRDAAIRCGDYTMSHWLNGKVWKMYGGEWDVPGNISSSSAAYATWGFAVLYRAAKYAPALDAVCYSADWHMTQQALFDTHIGFYMPKAYWRGRKFKSTGGFTQGVMDEGYGQLLWNRPEECYAQYMAWTVTKDRAYLDSAKAYLVWQTYMQHNCPYDYRFHGGGSEGYEWQKDTLNGYGTVYIGETIGCDLTLFALMDDGEIK